MSYYPETICPVCLQNDIQQDIFNNTICECCWEELQNILNDAIVAAVKNMPLQQDEKDELMDEVFEILSELYWRNIEEDFICRDLNPTKYVKVALKEVLQQK